MATVSNFDAACPPLEEIRQKLESGTLNSIRQVLPDSLVMSACTHAGYEFRQRLLTPTVVVLHLVLAAVWPEDSLAASWQVVWSTLVSRLPGAAGKSPSSGSVAKARARIPLAVWNFLFEAVAGRAAQLGDALNRWRGLRLVLVDGTCVSMSAAEELFAAFGTQNNQQGPGKYPLARLVTFALGNTKTILAYALGGYLDSETALVQTILDRLCAADLLIADRFFGGAHFYAMLLSRQVQFLTRMHQCLQPHRLKRLITYSADDFVAELPLSPQSRRKYPDLPPIVSVRFICFTCKTRSGREQVWLATSLISADDYPALEVAALYLRRWRIETEFLRFKVNLSADVLRCLTPDGIRKEIAARLLALNVVHTLMVEAALQEGLDPARISFVETVRTLLAFAPAMATANITGLPTLGRAMLREIGSHLVPERLGRQEPRMIRRERKHYPTLKTTREEWRAKFAAAS